MQAASNRPNSIVLFSDSGDSDDALVDDISIWCSDIRQQAAELRATNLLLSILEGRLSEHQQVGLEFVDTIEAWLQQQPNLQVSFAGLQPALSVRDNVTLRA